MNFEKLFFSQNWRFFGLLTLLLVITGFSYVEADEKIPGTKATVGKAVLRSWSEVAAAESLVPYVAGEMEIPVRPTMEPWRLKELKRQANSAPRGLRPNIPELLGPPAFQAISFDGVDSVTAGNLRPPDTHGAVGKSHFLEIVNSRIRVYTKAGDLARNQSLAAFFGYTLQTIFDPRAIYDSRWDRFVVVAEAFPESATVQRFFIGISKTNDPTSDFWIYNIDINTTNASELFDFPQLGQDQDTIIVTANIFNAAGTLYLGSRVYTFAKAVFYNGLAGIFVIFNAGSTGTITPPIVLDQNADAFLISNINSTNVNLFRLTNGSRGLDATLTNLAGIPVPAYGPPPDAPQPTQGTCNAANNLLDTSDTRFVNASTQIGDRLFNVHTINVGGSATPKWYEFDVEGAGAKTIIQSGTFFATGTSHDFNASIAANSARDVYVTWTATDPPAGTEPQVRFSGRRSTDPAGVIAAGLSLFNTPNGLCYDAGAGTGPERWGDYSAVTVDPLNALRAWVINEKLNSNTVWGTRIGRIGY